MPVWAKWGIAAALLFLTAAGTERLSARGAAGSLLKFTVLYDNYAAREGTKADWGFSCLIEGAEKTILFDTGTKPDILRHNVDALKADLGRVELVVLSHAHEDHTGGLPAVPQRNSNVEVLFPASSGEGFANRVAKTGASSRAIDGPAEICRNVFLTGEMGTAIREMSLILDTPRGLVVVTGCSHPGIVEILNRAKEIRNKPIHLVFGGFHLGGASEAAVRDILAAFKALGVERCGPTHCTGDRPIAMFKAAFGDAFLAVGTGTVIEVPGF
jgi:7,8-dihydropterin-6-yl-methyl-4-(beta-D-ribofuranosyl)aminobenzene 5'-phosphate synthase